MPGVRIQHPTERSRTFTIVDSSRPYRSPLLCVAEIVVDGELRPCARTHVFKTYHLNLDGAGATIVSETIWQRMAIRLAAAGFALANEVRDPPAQVVRVPFIPRRLQALIPWPLRATEPGG